MMLYIKSQKWTKYFEIIVSHKKWLGSNVNIALRKFDGLTIKDSTEIEGYDNFCLDALRKLTLT